MTFLEFVHQSVNRGDLIGELCQAIANDVAANNIDSNKRAWIRHIHQDEFYLEDNYTDDPLFIFELLWDEYLSFGQVTRYDIDDYEDYFSDDDDDEYQNDFENPDLHSYYMESFWPK